LQQTNVTDCDKAAAKSYLTKIIWIVAEFCNAVNQYSNYLSDWCTESAYWTIFQPL